MLHPMPSATDATPSPETIAVRRAAHERELRARRIWRFAVYVASFGLLAIYLSLLYLVRVMEPFYVLINVLAIITGLGSVIVYRVYELPTILAELPRLSEHQRRINLAAIGPTRAELLGRVLPSLGLAGTRDEAATLEDDELVRRLAGLERPDWRTIARACFVAWLLVVPTAFIGIAIYRPEHGVSLVERLQGKTPSIDRHWSPMQ
jgi:hypothetical protein